MQMKNKMNKKAFTLIELLIVIAIIGILFVVLVSRVDFATDKAKATGVQTDFRAFQVAFEQVAKENAGYASLGWDTGDANGDRKRNSYDEGDDNKNGKMESGEVWTGHKVYGETWTTVYTLVNPADKTDTSAFKALENAINSNLDPKLQIVVTPDKDGGNLTGTAVITMANQARDPWGNEYGGYYLTNAENDKLDRGSIVMYSKGANGKLGSNYGVANGLTGAEVPGNNVNGKDDYAMAVTYSYANGFGEILTGTSGFSNNQNSLTMNTVAGSTSNENGSVNNNNNNNNDDDNTQVEYEIFESPTSVITRSESVQFKVLADKTKLLAVKIDGNVINDYAVRRNTIVTLFGKQFDMLSDGIHTIELLFTDGSASTEFELAITCREHVDEDHGGLCAYCNVPYCSNICTDDNLRDYYCDYCGNSVGFPDNDELLADEILAADVLDMVVNDGVTPFTVYYKPGWTYQQLADANPNYIKIYYDTVTMDYGTYSLLVVDDNTIQVSPTDIIAEGAHTHWSIDTVEIFLDDIKFEIDVHESLTGVGFVNTAFGEQIDFYIDSNDHVCYDYNGTTYYLTNGEGYVFDAYDCWITYWSDPYYLVPAV